MKFCPKCGTENEDADKFCRNCGNELAIKNENNANVGLPVKYCQFCGEQIDARLQICPNCKHPLKIESEKSPVLALILSFILPGLGQLYNGQTRKFVILLIAAIVSAALILIFIGAILYLVVWAYGLYDAYTSAEAINRGEVLEDKLF